MTWCFTTCLTTVKEYIAFSRYGKRTDQSQHSPLWPLALPTIPSRWSKICCRGSQLPVKSVLTCSNALREGPLFLQKLPVNTHSASPFYLFYDSDIDISVRITEILKPYLFSNQNGSCSHSEQIHMAKEKKLQMLICQGRYLKKILKKVWKIDLTLNILPLVNGQDKNRTNGRLYNGVPQVPERRGPSELECFRRQLPVYERREEIVTTIKENQVVLIVGETGSGKTTQVRHTCSRVSTEWGRC